MHGQCSYGELVARKLEREPALLAVPLANIARWLDEGHSAPHRLQEWKELLQEAQTSAPAMRRLLRTLRAAEPEAERLRDFNPFAGILTREERRQASELCGYRH